MMVVNDILTFVNHSSGFAVSCFRDKVVNITVPMSVMWYNVSRVFLCHIGLKR